MARLAIRAGLAALLAPAVAWAQDATVLALAFGPPLLLVPLLVGWLRRRWLLPRNGTEASTRALVAVGIVEWLLWLLVGFLAATVIFDERWLALLLVGAGLAALLYTLRTLGAPHRSWRFTLAMVVLFPGVFVVAVLWSAVVAFVLG